MKEPDWKSNKLTFEDLYAPAMQIADQETADEYFEKLVLYNMHISKNLRTAAEEIERSNLGYYAGYFGHETRECIERLFQCEHPIFGSIAENGPPTPEQAFAMGMALGEKLRAIKHDLT